MAECETVETRNHFFCRKLPLILFFFTAFVSLYVFYTIVHPMYIFDLDDWLYISYGRHAFPTTSLWNPTKVLPETLLPLVSYIGVFFLYPLNGDYILSLLYVHAFTTVVFILVYLFFAARLLKKRFGLDDITLMVLLTVFLLAHFTPFFVKEYGSYHLFNSMNVNCFFNYTIPALWNFTMCFFFMAQDLPGKWYDSRHSFRKGMLAAGVYMAINSNLWTSDILMCYFGVRLLFVLVEKVLQQKRESKKWLTVQFILQYIIEEFPKMFAIGCWLVSMLFEFRSRRRGGFIDGSLELRESFEQLLAAIGSMNSIFWVCVLLCNGIALMAAIYRRKNKGDSTDKFLYRQSEMLLCMVLCAVYQVLLGSVVGANYVSRSDTLMCWMLWLLMMSASSLAYLYKLQPRIQWIMPLLAWILLIEITVSYPTFVGNYASSETPSQVKAINDDIIIQIVEAEKAGMTQVDVHLPEAISWGWPLDTEMSPERIAWTLYYHGITERYIHVTFVPDPAKDAQFLLK